MTGTLLNVIGVLLGCGAGLAMRRPLSAQHQHRLKLLLAAFTIWVGIITLWRAINGRFTQCLKQVGIAMLALMLGALLGRLLRLQKGFNRLGQYAGQRFTRPDADARRRFNEGFLACAVVFTFNPLGIVGALQDGLDGHYQTLAVKTAMDALAAMGFISVFGSGVPLAVIPLAALQGGLSLGAHALTPSLSGPMIDSVHAAAALIVISATMLITESRKVPLADYLPALAVAPLLTWLWR